MSWKWWLHPQEAWDRARQETEAREQVRQRKLEAWESNGTASRWYPGTRREARELERSHP